MEQKRNYVVYTEDGNMNCEEHVVKMTTAQAEAIEWFMNTLDIDGCVALAEEYNGEEI